VEALERAVRLALLGMDIAGWRGHTSGCYEKCLSQAGFRCSPFPGLQLGRLAGPGGVNRRAGYGRCSRAGASNPVDKCLFPGGPGGGEGSQDGNADGPGGRYSGGYSRRRVAAALVNVGFIRHHSGQVNWAPLDERRPFLPSVGP